MKEVENSNPWSDVPPDLAERVAALLSSILSEQFDAKVTVIAGSRESWKSEVLSNAG